MIYAMALQGLTTDIFGARLTINNIKATANDTLDQVIRVPNASSTRTNRNFNVVDYGAIGDGRTDDSQAFTKAWGDACGATGGVPVYQIPSGKTFFLKPITFDGPCKSPSIRIQVRSTLKMYKNHGDSYFLMLKNARFIFSEGD
ncbi:hypothetical protein Ancab_001707 [Ancistrocladus abbreviatus]